MIYWTQLIGKEKKKKQNSKWFNKGQMSFCTKLIELLFKCYACLCYYVHHFGVVL